MGGRARCPYSGHRLVACLRSSGHLPSQDAIAPSMAGSNPCAPVNGFEGDRIGQCQSWRISQASLIAVLKKSRVKSLQGRKALSVGKTSRQLR
jgi:hypothetical protein